MKNKNINLLIGLILLVVSMSFCSAGTAGFGKIAIQSNYPGLDCPDGCWVFNWVDDSYTNDAVRASWDKEDINSKQDIDISIDGTSNKCQYNINREANRKDIFTIKILDNEEDYPAWQYPDPEDKKAYAINMMHDMGCLHMDEYPDGYAASFGEIYGFFDKSMRVVCVQKKDTYGLIGSLGNLKYVTQTKFLIDVDGEGTQTEIVSNDDSGSGKSTRIGNDVFVQWQGLLSSGETCPISTEELMAYDSDFSSNWQVIDRQNYYLYENYVKSELDSLMHMYYTGGYSKSGAESIVNNKASSAILKRNFANFNVNIISTSLSNGRLSIDLDRQIKYPMFRLIIDSDYLELLIPTGEPKITCPKEDIEFKEGEPGEIKVRAENIGDGEGGFSIRVLSCDGGFSSGDVEGIILGAGDYEYVTLSTTAYIDNLKASGECIIEMKETITGETKTCKVNLEATKPAECVEGRVWCSYDGTVHVIKKCIDGKEKIFEDCEQSEICDVDDKGVPYCKEKDDDDNGGTLKCADCSAFSKSYLLGEVFPEMKCEKKLTQGVFGCLTSILKLFAVPLIFIFVFAFGSKKLKPMFKDKNMQWISIVLSLVIASVIAYFVYTMFTVGIIIAVIFIVLSILITIFFPGVTMAVAGAGSTAGAIGGAVRGIKGRKKE